MSIISIHEADKSDLMYKRFASLAVSYLDHGVVEHPATQVPLENLFRLLEMYRYDAFSDESRRGILAVEKIDDDIGFLPVKTAWHTKIEDALNKAISGVFERTSKEDAVLDLEETLRLLSSNSAITEESRKRAKKFFGSFLDELK